MVHKTTFALIFACAAALGAARPLPAQEEPTGPRLRTNALEIAFDGRVQTQFTTTTIPDEPDFELLVRRVYLGAAVRVNDVVGGRVQADFAGNRVTLKDTYLSLSFGSGLEFLAGNAYRPFSLLTQTSDVRILPVERGVRIRGLEALEQQTLVTDLGYSDRDIGLQLRGAPAGAPLGLSYTAGFFRGPQPAVGAENVYQLVGRLAIEPVRNVRFGTAWSSRSFADERGTVEQGSAWEVDAWLGSFDAGPNLMAEVAWGDLDPFQEARFRSAQAWLGYRTGPVSRTIRMIEPVFRASYGDPDAPFDELGGVLLTPGLNVYLGGENRIMLNYDVWSAAAGGRDAGSLKAMFQLSF